MNRLKALILRELAISKKSIWELLERINSPIKDFIPTLKKLVEEDLIRLENGNFCLTEKGKAEINQKSVEFEGKICKSCLGKRIVFDKKFNEVFEKFKELVKERPRPSSEFFQGYMLQQDVIARVAFMHYYNDLEGKNIVLIGDDDLLSVALALTNLPSRITVLDIDKRLGDFLNTLNKTHGLNIEFVEYDVADTLPPELKGKFDVFSSEPLETLSGLKAFIIRGVSCLKENGVGYFGLTRYEASYKKWLVIQKLLVNMNCVVTDIIQGFSVYPMDYGNVSYEGFVSRLGLKIDKNPGINWYKSALFRFEVLGSAKLPASAEKKMKIKYIDPEEDLTHPLISNQLEEKSS
jgi:predicted methyltransferase